MQPFIDVRLVASYLAVLLLAILPMPDLFYHIRPAWTLLLFVYLLHYRPDGFSRVRLIIMGLLLDVLFVSSLGTHAFALLLGCWSAMPFVRRFRLFTIGQQMVYLFMVVFVYYAALAMVNVAQGLSVSLITYLGSCFLSVLIWPWVRILLQDVLPVRFKLN